VGAQLVRSDGTRHEYVFDAAQVRIADRGRRLHLDADEHPVGSFEHHVDLVGGRSEVVHGDRSCVPAALALDLSDHEVLDQRSAQRRVLLETCHVYPHQMREETGIRQVRLRVLRDARVQSSRPSRDLVKERVQSSRPSRDLVKEEETLEDRQIAAYRHMRNIQ